MPPKQAGAGNVAGGLRKQVKRKEPDSGSADGVNDSKEKKRRVREPGKSSNGSNGSAKGATEASEEEDVAMGPVNGGEPPVDRHPSWLFRRYEEAAKVGDPIAQYGLAQCYREGKGVEKDEKRALEWLEKAAASGEPSAQYELAGRYERGEGVGEDAARAVQWYSKAAEAGHLEAQYELGRCYEEGTGVEKDEKQAVEWLSKAAEGGNAGAQFQLGQCLQYGEGTARDADEAFQWYLKAAEAGHAGAQYKAAHCYKIGIGVEVDDGQAVRYYLKAAEGGDGRAQNEMADRYKRGKGVPRDLERAVYWLCKVAETGNRDARYQLGLRYENGDGVAKDEKKAVEWYREAATGWHRGAYISLGLCYEHGRGVEKDVKQALQWYKQAIPPRYPGKAFPVSPAQKADAYYHLGRCYESGIGVEKDLQRAVRLYENALSHRPEHHEALRSLARCYRNGVGANKDETKASRLCRQAACAGDVESQFELARCYETGNGMEKDSAVALCWYEKAAEGGHPEALLWMGRRYAEMGEGEDENAADNKKAVEYFEAAAKAGSSAAQYELACCYEKGMGVGEDHCEAVRLFKLAAEGGHSDAQYEMGRRCARGEGMPKDWKLAAEWYGKAAETGDLDSQYELGKCYRDGKGVEKDTKEAMAWLSKAAEQEHEIAQKALQALRADLSLDGSDEERPPELQHEVKYRVSSTVKFRQLHYLNYCDAMEDGFSDPGRGDQSSMSLEELKRAPLPKGRGRSRSKSQADADVREVLHFSSQDDELKALVEEAARRVGPVKDARQRAEMLALLVSDRLGGRPTNAAYLLKESDNVVLAAMKARKSRVVPISDFFGKPGVCRHRSLLFKYLADRLNERFSKDAGNDPSKLFLPVRLVRGSAGAPEDSHAWNVVLIEGKHFVLDLMQPDFGPVPMEEAAGYLRDGPFGLPKKAPGAGMVSIGLRDPCFIPRQELKVTKKIGSGGYGVCELADWKVTPHGVKEVVVKRAPESLRREEAGLLRELHNLFLLEHPHIIKLYGFCVNPLGLVMEYVPDGNILQVLNKQPNIPLEERLLILSQVASALAFCHGAPEPVVHRDLKPENVLYDCETKTARLIDFGLARVGKELANVTDATLGTPPYTAPEALCTSEQLTPAADVYSFGCFAYEVVTSELLLPENYRRKSSLLVIRFSKEYEKPKEAQGPVFTVGKKLLDAAAELGEQAERFGQLLDSCLHVDPSKRPSMENVALQLEGFLQRSRGKGE